jgi:hypothetical protein
VARYFYMLAVLFPTLSYLYSYLSFRSTKLIITLVLLVIDEIFVSVLVFNKVSNAPMPKKLLYFKRIYGSSFETRPMRKIYSSSRSL